MCPSCHRFQTLMQVHAFVAPKIIGGKNAPTPVSDLGMVEMTQALELIDVCYEQVNLLLCLYFNQLHTIFLCRLPLLSLSSMLHVLDMHWICRTVGVQIHLFNVYVTIENFLMVQRVVLIYD